jgi:hypothetical protein
MTKAKIAVTVSPAVLAKARKAVRARKAASLSAYVEAALEEKATFDDLAGLLDEMLAESGGPMTAAERRAADRVLGISARRKGWPAA